MKRKEKHMPAHRDRELAVFHDFAVDARLEVDLSSIEKMDPPYPDIRCRAEDGRTLHFEISEILDPEYAALLTRFRDGRLAAKGYYERLSEPKLSVFNERFADSSIFLNYVNDATSRQRDQSLPAIFDFLLSLPPNRPKAVEFEESLPSPIVERIAVYRDHGPSKPLFESAFGTNTNASALTVVKKKVKKTYRADGSVSLLAFWYEQPMLPDDVWQADVERYIEDSLHGSIFVDCWVYDWSSRTVKLRRPQQRVGADAP